jgi:cytochrome b
MKEAIGIVCTFMLGILAAWGWIRSEWIARRFVLERAKTISLERNVIQLRLDAEAASHDLMGRTQVDRIFEAKS